MARRIDEGAVVVLPVDLDGRRADGAQNLDADRLVVDEGAGAPVGELDPTQDQVALRIDVALRRDAPGGMVWSEIEHGRDLALLLAVAHEAPVAAAAQRQRESVEQDRFPRAGLAGEHAQAVPEGELEPVDQDDVADRELDEHAREVEPVETAGSLPAADRGAYPGPGPSRYDGPQLEA